MDEASGEADRNRVSTPTRLAFISSKLLRRPEIVAAASALIGLGIGVVVGRESIQGETASNQRSKVTQAKASVVNADENQEEDDDEIPSSEYRRHLGRRVPKGSVGFGPLALPGRRTAQLTGNEGTLRFELDPSEDAYALTAIVHVEKGKKADLQPLFDGKPLASSTLPAGWSAYFSPVPNELLGKHEHELTFRVAPGTDKPVVGVDSVAVAPTGSGVSFTFGPRGVGALVEGFSKPGGESVWSDGDRSVVGVALSPAAGDYRLTVKAGALSRLAPLTVSARVNGKNLGTAVFAKRATESSWSVPAKALTPGLNRIEFSYPQTARPSEYNPKSQDNRLLALRFYSLTLQPER